MTKLNPEQYARKLLDVVNEQLDSVPKHGSEILYCSISVVVSLTLCLSHKEKSGLELIDLAVKEGIERAKMYRELNAEEYK